MIARPAQPADAAELVRLRAVLLRTMSPPSPSSQPSSQPSSSAAASAASASSPASASAAGSGSGSGSGWNDDWREPSRQTLEQRLAEPEPTLAAFVVDRPDGAGLAACVVGSVEHRLGNPTNLTGRVGYVFSVATDPDMRRRGYSRACLTALLDWYRDQGINKIDLRASADGEPLYESLGFTRTEEPAMRLHLPARVAP